ncbi:MAG: CAP domain-containing protein [Kofleriaceae bacterium]
MKLASSLGIVVALVASCGADDGGGGGGGGEPVALAGILAAHNQVRASHGQAALSWDDDLAEIAATWAAACVDVEAPAGLIDHNPGRSDTYPEYVGENIFGSSAPTTGTSAVSAWASEESDYDYDTNTCTGVCGHYTQLVWAETTKVGCAMHACPGLTFGNAIVCNYAPGGNVNGRRPY